MIRRIIQRIRQWLAVRKLMHSRLLMLDWSIQARRLLKKLERRQRRLAKLSDDTRRIQDDLDEMSSQFDELTENHQRAMEALQSENDILSEQVVPQLTAANRMHLERWNAEVAIQVRKQYTLQPQENEVFE